MTLPYSPSISFSLDMLKFLDEHGIAGGSEFHALISQAKMAVILRDILEPLEWSGKIGCEGFSMGGPPKHMHTCCPMCKGVQPDMEVWKCWRPESVGHKPGCKLAAVLE